MKVIAFYNLKGGVGKTASAVNIAHLASRSRLRTLLWDLDPQGAASWYLGRDDAASYSAKKLLNKKVAPATLASETAYDRLSLIPSDFSYRNFDLAYERLGDSAQTLKKIIDPFGETYSLAVLDCPPSLGILTTNALCAATEVLIPLQTEYFAMRGLQSLLETVEQVKTRLNPGLDLAGIVATMYTTGTVHAREVLEEIQDVFGEKVLDVIIYKSIRFAEATVANQAIIEYAPDHKGAEAYQQLANILIKQQKG